MRNVTPSSNTVLQALLICLEKATVHNSNVMVALATMLWPDEQRQWEALLPVLRETCPCLLTLGEYNPEERTAPAIRIKCMLGRRLEASPYGPQKPCQLPIFRELFDGAKWLIIGSLTHRDWFPLCGGRI
jgi:hypothetical protein